MPRKKKAARPDNNKAPATAADGTNPPIAKDKKVYIKYLIKLLNNINILKAFYKKYRVAHI